MVYHNACALILAHFFCSVNGSSLWVFHFFLLDRDCIGLNFFSLCLRFWSHKIWMKIWFSLFFQFPYEFRELCLFAIFLMVERLLVICVSFFEGSFSETNVHFLLTSFQLYSCFVWHLLLSSFHGGGIHFSLYSCTFLAFFLLFLIQNTRIVLFDYSSHVSGATIASFDGVTVKYLTEPASPWKMLSN